jgi:hypothetical protein
MEADASRYHGKVPDEIDWSVPERQTGAVAEFLRAKRIVLVSEVQPFIFIELNAVWSFRSSA